MCHEPNQEIRRLTAVDSVDFAVAPGEVWSASGRLVGQSRQLVLLPEGRLSIRGAEDCGKDGRVRTTSGTLPGFGSPPASSHRGHI